MKKLLIIVLLFAGMKAGAQTAIAPSVGASPTVLAGSGLLNSTTAINPATHVILAASATSAAHIPIMLQLNAVVYCTAASSGTVQLQFNYTDIGGTAQTYSATAASCATLGSGSTSYISLPVMIQGGTAIYGGTVLTGSATYSVGLVILQVAI